MKSATLSWFLHRCQIRHKLFGCIFQAGCSQGRHICTIKDYLSYWATSFEPEYHELAREPLNFSGPKG